MRQKPIEVSVGLFMLAGIIALLVLALKVSGLSTYIGKTGYLVSAEFDNIGGLKIRSAVTIAGVRVGEIAKIQLDSSTYRAIVTMRINPNQDKLPTDTSASILTQGLLGANYISLTPGFDADVLKDGSKIDHTQPALILEDLIGQLIFSLKNSDPKKSEPKKTESKNSEPKH